MYIGQWEDNKENGHGAHYCPPIDAPIWSASKKPVFSLFVGEFTAGYPTHGVLLEGENVLETTPDDIIMASKMCNDHHTSIIPSCPCRVYRVLYDGSSAFWQHPFPVEKVGEFEIRVKLCQYETRALVKTFFSSEKIDDVWYKVTLSSDGTKKPNLMSAKRDDQEDGEDGAAAKQAPQLNAAPHSRTRKLYKIVRFRGMCVRNKAGLFPCPTEGILFDEGRKFEVEYDGKSPLSVFPKPIRVHGEYICDVPCTDSSRKSLPVKACFTYNSI